MTENMRKVRIVTDTTAVLPQDYLKKHEIEVIPQVILIGEDSYVEDQDITFEEFIEMLKKTDAIPKTAAPPIQSAEEAFRKQLLNNYFTQS